MKIIDLKDMKEWPEIGPLSPEELAEAYALARASFTADDLQKFTEIDTNPIPMEDLLAEMEQKQQEHDRKIAP